MILYKPDWGLQPTVTVQTNTSNDSFIKMHYVLKEMGIENNAFFLALHQPELADVNPHDPENLSAEICCKIAIECKLNPWYYLREIVRIPAQGTPSVPFILNRASLFLFWAYFNSVSTYLVQPRQTGKTITSMALMVLLLYFTYVNTRIRLYTHSTQLIHSNVEKLKLIRDELPKYLVNLSKNDVENKESIQYAQLKNVYVTSTSQASVASAFNVGRGDTILSNQLDELPFCINNRISYPVLMNAKNAAVRNARANNIPHGDIITTTAGKLDTDSGAFAYDILRKSLAFTEKFYDLQSNAELRFLLKNGSKNNILYGEYSFRQLGYTREWCDEVIRENNLEGDAVKRDMYNEWTSGGARPAVKPELLAKIDAFKCDPSELKDVDNYLFRWYEPEEKVWKDKNRWFVIGLDTSENINEDFTTVHMLDIADLSTIATSKCNDEDIIKLGYYLARVLIEHPNVTLVPERKSTAAALISIISTELWKAGINPFTRIYNRVLQHRNETPYDRVEINTPYASEGPTKKYIGYTTSATGENSRDALYKFTLNRALGMNYAVLRDKSLIQELKTLTISDRGRIDHTVSGHDDMVIAFMLAAWFVLFGKNHQLYGIPLHLKLSRVAVDGVSVDVSKAERQRSLGIRINGLDGQIRATSNPIIRGSLEQEKHFLTLQLESLGPDVAAIQTVADLESPSRGLTIEDIVYDPGDSSPARSYRENFERRARDPYGRMKQYDQFSF